MAHQVCLSRLPLFWSYCPRDPLICGHELTIDFPMGAMPSPVIAKYNGAMRCTSLLTTFSIALACFAPLPVWAGQKTAEAVRQIVFPQQFSLGALYNWPVPGWESLPAPSEIK